MVDTFARGTEMLLALDIVDEGGQVERVVTTGEHPFYRLELGRFVRAEELAAGDGLLSSSGSWLKVGSATWVQQSATVYNLTVGGFPMYFVGTSGVWVHNKASYRPSKGSTIDAAKGTRAPRDLREQLVVEEVMGNPGLGAHAKKMKMGDSRWPAEDGWQKMEYVRETAEGNVNVHYNYNPKTGQADDFKIKFKVER